MDDIETRLTDLASHVAGQSHRDKQAAWSRLQREDPNAARHIAAVKEVFGRPAAVEIRIGDWIYRSGTFLHAMDYPDVESRIDNEDVLDETTRECHVKAPESLCGSSLCYGHPKASPNDLARRK